MVLGIEPNFGISSYFFLLYSAPFTLRADPEAGNGTKRERKTRESLVKEKRMQMKKNVKETATVIPKCQSCTWTSSVTD